ncbi:MAG: ABC transporter substrate-binding protein [Thermoplasmata archaeon]
MLKIERMRGKNGIACATVGFLLLFALIPMPNLSPVFGEAVGKSVAPKSPPYGGVFKIGFLADMKTLNPCGADDIWSWRVLSLVYDSLSIPSKENLSPIPFVAENWSMETEDGLNWTVKIREGIKWHDGVPLTADDVVFTYNFLHDVSRYVASLESLDWTPLGNPDMNETFFAGVQKVDDYTVKFRLWRPNPTFLFDVMGVPLLPKHIWRNHWHDKTTWNMDYNPATGEANVIGSGPFKFKYWLWGAEVKLERNPEYFWKTTLSDGQSYNVPFVDAINIIIYKNMDAMVTALKQGEIDYIWEKLDPGWIPVLSEIPGVKVFVNNDTVYTYLGFNLMLPFEGYDTETGYQPRHNKSDPVTYPQPEAGEDAGLIFRKAVSHCIDKETILRNALQGFGIVGDSIVSPAYSLWYNESVPRYEYDLNISRSLLDAGNYIDVNGDGWREDYKGRTLD